MAGRSLWLAGDPLLLPAPCRESGPIFLAGPGARAAEKPAGSHSGLGGGSAQGIISGKAEPLTRLSKARVSSIFPTTWNNLSDLRETRRDAISEAVLAEPRQCPVFPT